MTKKTFELATIISLANGNCILGVTEQQKKELVDHIHGIEITAAKYKEKGAEAVKYLVKNYPRIADAIRLCSAMSPDYARYQKLIDLCRKNHEIETMVKKTKVKSDEELVTA